MNGDSYVVNRSFNSALARAGQRCSTCGLEQIQFNFLKHLCQELQGEYRARLKAFFFSFFLSSIYRSFGGFPEKNKHKYIQVISLFRFVCPHRIQVLS